MFDPHSTSDRYVVSGNLEAEFVDEAQTILVNKKGITDLHTLYVEEEKGVARAYEQLLQEMTGDTPITCDLIKYVHKAIFGELYKWAGNWRTVRISKQGAPMWPPPDFLAPAMVEFEKSILRRYPAKALADEDAFCDGIAHIQGEFLSIHPLREGNARTIKLTTDLLAIQTGRIPLQYDDTEAGKHAYIEAAKAAMLAQDYSLMKGVISGALRVIF